MTVQNQKKRRKPNPYPPCDDPVFAEGRAKRESGTTTLGNVAIKFQAMIGGAAKAAYSRTYIGEYKKAWDKDWPYLCEMLDIIEKEKIYSEFWMKDGVPQQTYPTFEAYCEAEVEPFVGPIADLRERYLELKDGKIDVEGGARQQRRAQTVSRCRKAYLELQADGEKVTQQAVADQAEVARSWVTDLWGEIVGETPTVGNSPTKPTHSQRAAALGVSDEQLRRMDIVAKHPDLHHKTALPKTDPQYISTRAAYLEVRRREGRGSDLDIVEPIRRTLMKLDEPSQRIVIEWVLEWAKDQGYIP